MGRYARQLFGAMAAGLALLFAATAGAFALAYHSVKDDWQVLIHTDEPTWAMVSPIVICVVVAYVVLMLLTLLVNSFLSAVSPVVLEHAVLGRRTTFGAVWRRAWARTPSVLGVTLFMYLLIAIPVALFFLVWVSLIALLVAAESPLMAPGFVFLLGLLALPMVTWLVVSFSFAPAAAVLESAGPITALKRSFRLVRGAWWRTFGILSLTWGMVGVTGWIVQIPLLFAGPQPSYDAYGPYDEPPADVGEFFSEVYGDALPGLWTYLVITVVVMLVVQRLATAFTQLVGTLLYIDQRIRREGLGESLARAVGHQ
ncbi:DUF7847 domain-containing protein [Streptomyces cahuitamycinicus]|uniref:DUF7847 domain-containing protein n=1 Tax=Streptomyces cahuitamycinicus TaxID=2070367 RepID=A0A2N8TUQ8_9ACTN|nr:hypothetical protein [Streptomyces cahuitamycinicus]PNG22737.1 hypothetical protein C1J00_07715 [Streptomyces cahuitamycinicus]